MRMNLLCACIAIASVSLHGCGTLSTAASMRVDVDVYKGPLSEESKIQLGGLCGVLNELDSSLQTYKAGVVASLAILPRKPPLRYGEATNCVAESEQRGDQRPVPLAQCWCGADNLDASQYPYARSEQLACFTAAEVMTNVRDVERRLEQIRKSTDNGLCANAVSASANQCTDESQAQLETLAQLAVQMKFKSLYRSYWDLAFMPQSRPARITSAAYQNLMADYSNQLASRADAILKQCKVDAQLQPQSVFLRDSRPTDFDNVYVWNRAAAPALIEDMILHPIRSFSSDETADRVRGVERLIADHYWSTINTVYTSGQGDVSMAFVRDAIGNWQLKAFTNDPTELLQAYKKAGLAVLKAATEAAKTSAGVPDAQKLLSLANTLNFGAASDVSAAPSQNAALLHEKARLQLESIAQAAGSPGANDADLIAKAQKVLDEHEAAVNALKVDSKPTTPALPGVK